MDNLEDSNLPVNVSDTAEKATSYLSVEELWEGIHNYDQHVHVPSTCMGAVIVMRNLSNPKLTPYVSKVNTELIQNSDGTCCYYEWPMELIDCINKQYRLHVELLQVND